MNNSEQYRYYMWSEIQSRFPEVTAAGQQYDEEIEMTNCKLPDFPMVDFNIGSWEDQLDPYIDKIVDFLKQKNVTHIKKLHLFIHLDSSNFEPKLGATCDIKVKETESTEDQ